MALVAPFATTLLSGAALFLAAAPYEVVAQQSLCPNPLASQHYDYPAQILQPNADVIRGQQSGFNICNSTTENQDSLCQTSFLNSLDDFCLWAPPQPNSVIADTEGEEVAWCTKPGRTHLFLSGVILAYNSCKLPDYIQVVGFIDQTKINIQAGDFGGELDPHGADLCGNPMGSLLYSNHWSGGADKYTQVIEWHNFMGGDAFCFKACNPAGKNAAHFCEHIYDRIGCAYNAPNNAQKGVFESCQGDNQDFPGIFTDASGKVQTYTQPPESLGAISTIPYQPKVPASSNCQQFASSDLFKALASVTATVSSTSVTSSVSSVATTSSGAATTAQTTAATASKSSSGSSSSASSSPNSASTVVIGSVATFFGVVGSVLFLS
ncbi:hypothetical protein DL96DRAFT_1813352 [Flagelloscypha sp. PMI_526]|nr:hypothetical protein DL96DRAFT_1813352 [Flagelloscypha sp. PMI_526]